MIIHCTQKMAVKLSEVSAEPLLETSPLGSWHALLYTVNRRQCVMFCHDASRYILFLPSLVKADFADLGRLHRELFLATLAKQGVADLQLKKIALALGPMRYDCATDRSVLGSMNVARSDLSFALEFEERALDPIAIAGRLNKRPTRAGRVLIWPERAMLELVNGL
ncbi:MAG: hypothetical protein HZA15_00805 [Nitrospirae bacterium]|nr:hypothetical protein [Nitrospirota bacterium]